MPFFTTSPTNSTQPISDEALSGICAAHNVASAPTTASGTVTNTANARRARRNCASRTDNTAIIPKRHHELSSNRVAR